MHLIVLLLYEEVLKNPRCPKCSLMPLVVEKSKIKNPTYFHLLKLLECWCERDLYLCKNTQIKVVYNWIMEIKLYNEYGIPWPLLWVSSAVRILEANTWGEKKDHNQ